jgi:hypothetical protein
LDCLHGFTLTYLSQVALYWINELRCIRYSCFSRLLYLCYPSEFSYKLYCTFFLLSLLLVIWARYTILSVNNSIYSIIRNNNLEPIGFGIKKRNSKMSWVNPRQLQSVQLYSFLSLILSYRLFIALYIVYSMYITGFKPRTNCYGWLNIVIFGSFSL